MSDTESQSSSKSVKQTKKEETTLEEKIGFKPSGANNYFCNIYNHSSLERTMLFDGAIPLHEFTPLLYEFIEKYVNDAKSDESYNLTVITGEDPNVSIATFSGKLSGTEKYQTTRKLIEKIIFILDNIYGVFIIDENKKGREYRKYVKFNDLLNSYNIYKTIKPKLYKLISNLE